MATAEETGFPTTIKNEQRVLVVYDKKSLDLLEEIWFRLQEIKEMLLGG